MSTKSKSDQIKSQIINLENSKNEKDNNSKNKKINNFIVNLNLHHHLHPKSATKKNRKRKKNKFDKTKK